MNKFKRLWAVEGQDEGFTRWDIFDTFSTKREALECIRDLKDYGDREGEKFRWVEYRAFKASRS